MLASASTIDTLVDKEASDKNSPDCQEEEIENKTRRSRRRVEGVVMVMRRVLYFERPSLVRPFPTEKDDGITLATRQSGFMLCLMAAK